MAMRVSLTLVVMLALVIGCNGCGDKDEGEMSGEIGIAGSSTVYPISAAVAEEFMRQHPGVKVSVSSTGTGGGFKNFFIPGKTPINDASRPIKDSELEQCRENGIEVIELQVGIDALSMVCNPKADWVDSMTFAQLKQIWGPGEAPQRWNEVDASWPDAKFELYGPAPTSGTFDYFTEVVIGDEDAHRSDYTKSEHDNMLVQGIEGDKHALGYFGFAYYVNNQDKLKALAIAKTADDEPVKPSLDNAQSGAYPLSRPLFIYVNKNELEKPHVKAFVEFYIRQSATDLISNEGYVPITEEQMKENLAKIGITE